MLTVVTCPNSLISVSKTAPLPMPDTVTFGPKRVPPTVETYVGSI